MQTLVLVLALGSVLADDATTSRTVPDGYTQLPNGGYYKYGLQRKSWHQARDICAQDGGGYLAVVESPEEMATLVDWWSVYPWMRNPFIGVYRLNSTSDWITVRGEPLGNYTGWGERFPQSTGDCIFLHALEGANYNTGCDLRGQFLCELDL